MDNNTRSSGRTRGQRSERRSTRRRNRGSHDSSDEETHDEFQSSRGDTRRMATRLSGRLYNQLAEMLGSFASEAAPRVAGIPRYVNDLASESTVEVTTAAEYLQHLMTDTVPSPAHEIVDAGALVLIPQVIGSVMDEETVHLLLWLLAKLIQAKAEYSLIGLENGCVEVMIGMMFSESGSIVERALDLCGSLAAGNASVRDLCLQSGALFAMEEGALQHLDHESVNSELCNAVAFLCTGEPAPQQSALEQGIDLLFRVIELDQDNMKPALNGLVKIVRNSGEVVIKYLEDRDIFAKLKPAMSMRSTSTEGALSILLELATLDESSLQTMFDLGFLDDIIALNNTDARIQDFQFMEAFAQTGKRQFITKMISGPLIPNLVDDKLRSWHSNRVAILLSHIFSNATREELVGIAETTEVLKNLCHCLCKPFGVHYSEFGSCLNSFVVASETLAESLKSEHKIAGVLGIVSSYGNELVDSLAQLAEHLDISIDEISEEEIDMARELYAEEEEEDEEEEEEEEEDERNFDSLNDAVVYWVQAAEITEHEGEAAEYLPEVESAFQRPLLIFLSMLKGAKEFRAEGKVGLAKRVVELLECMKHYPEAKADLLVRISDSIDACDDKPVWALNQAKVVILLSQARGSREKLRALALRIMRLEVVHKHARIKLEKLGHDSDDVCVYLRFEIELRSVLDLPVSALSMWFPDYSSISTEEISACVEEAMSITDEALDAFLSTWEEWARQERSEVAREVEWKNLKRSSRSFRQSLRNILGSSVSDPVRFASEKAEFSLQDLLRHWVDTGLDLNNVRRSMEDIRCLLRG